MRADVVRGVWLAATCASRGSQISIASASMHARAQQRQSLCPRIERCMQRHYPCLRMLCYKSAHMLEAIARRPDARQTHLVPYHI